MMKLMMAGALALVTACAAQARNEAHSDAPPAARAAVVEEAAHSPRAFAPSAVTCDIRATRTRNGVRLEAIAHAGRAVRGDYRFVISAEGSGGSSDITQGGAVELTAGRSATVGSAEMSRGRYRAVLTLSDADGELCRTERRS